MTAVEELSARVGSTLAACEALDVPRASFYRQRKPEVAQDEKSRPRPPLALQEAEVQAVLARLYAALKPGRWLSLCYHDTDPGTSTVTSSPPTSWCRRTAS